MDSIVAFTFAFLLQGISGSTFRDMEALQIYLSNSSRDVKPRVNQSHSVNIDVLMSLGTIQDYDEISATLKYAACFGFFWTDEIRTWDPNNYGGIVATKIPILKTWIPTLNCRNCVSGSSFYKHQNTVDIEGSVVTYDASGKATVQLLGTYDETCDSDVTYYPFDEHVCTIIVLTTDPLNDLTLTSIHGMYIGLSTPNSEWAIKANSLTTVKSTLPLNESGFYYMFDQIEFSFVIRRQGLFPMLNIVLPIILLSLVHLVVFILPIESGEKASFAFTLLLTFVVFMTMVTERLPPSTNISVFNIFLIGQLFTSILTTTLVVIGLWMFYHNQDLKDLNVLHRFVLRCYLFSCKRLLVKNKINDMVDNIDKFSIKMPTLR